MPASSQEGMWAAVGAAAVAALTGLSRLIRPRKPKVDRAAEERSRLDAEWARLDDEKSELLAEIRDELADCRKRSDELDAKLRAEQLRVQILIRVIQGAGIAVPDMAQLDVDFDAATATWTLRETV
jgi:hypothetical protein